MLSPKYISFNGRKLKVYPIRKDYYAIDNDVAEFFKVSKKYVLFRSSALKQKYPSSDKIALTKNAVKSIYGNKTPPYQNICF
ncbi:MAG: hypothetical protein JW871_02505 [Endomicrobiales bacterium]|nr:hypothetical protein [Endomicrobiales bacterium]